MTADEQMGKVSVVGAGMRSHPGVAAKVFQTLGEKEINIEMISTSPIKISCVIAADRVPDAVQALHEAFELGRDAVERSRTGARDERLAPRVAVVGATGAVGSTMLEVMAERGFAAREVVPLASERSAGRTVAFGDEQLEVRALRDDAIEGFDIALFSAGGGVSREWAPRFRDAGCVVVDNSSAWRMEPNVPLVVAEVNGEALDRHEGIVANPNCSTMQMVMALKPILDAVGIERVIVSTYQSTSGTGQHAVEELRDQTAGGARANAT